MKPKELTQYRKSDLSALEYLAVLFSGAPGYIQLVAIKENSPLRVQTASVNDVESLEPFLQYCITDEYNIYYQVNPVRDDIKRKAKKEDILCCWNAHVDIDPESPSEESANVEYWATKKAELIEKVSEEETSFIVDSGGGIQLILRLSPHTNLPEATEDIEEWRAIVADCESINKQLIVKYGGDLGTQDVSRLMRLPGTENHPTTKKREVGRIRSSARILHASARTFDPAKLERDGNTQGNDFEKKTIVDFKRVVCELAISKRLRELLMRGEGSEDYKSRSEALFAVACGLARSGMSTERAADVLMHAPSLVGNKAREKGRKWLCAEYQRAWKFVMPEYVRRFNNDHFVVITGGKTVVVEESKLQNPETFQSAFVSPSNFRSAHSEIVAVGERQNGAQVRKPIAVAQVEHPQRRGHSGILLAPSEPPVTKSGAYNLWRGFGVEPDTNGSWDLLHDLVYSAICGKNDDNYEYLMGWAARCVQFPDQQAEVAIVLRGERGVGKGTFLSTLCKLFRPHSYHTANSRILTNDFNGQLLNVLFLFLDEAFWAGEHPAESSLKAYITEPSIELHPKFQAAYMTKNHLKIGIASNSDWVVPAGTLERRFFVLDVSNEFHRRLGFFEQLHAELDNGGYGALLHELKNYDLDGFNVRDVPNTVGLVAQQIQSADPMEKWIYACLSQNRWSDREFETTFGIWADIPLENGGSKLEFCPSRNQPDSFIGPFPKAFLHEEFLAAFPNARAQYNSRIVFGRKLIKILRSTYSRARGEPWISKSGVRETSQRCEGEAYRFSDPSTARADYLRHMGWAEWPNSGDQ